MEEDCRVKLTKRMEMFRNAETVSIKPLNAVQLHDINGN